VILVYGLIIHHDTLAALSQCLYTVVHEAAQCSHSVPQGWMMKMCSNRQTYRRVVTGQVVAAATGSRVQGVAK